MGTKWLEGKVRYFGTTSVVVLIRIIRGLSEQIFEQRVYWSNLMKLFEFDMHSATGTQTLKYGSMFRSGYYKRLLLETCSKCVKFGFEKLEVVLESRLCSGDLGHILPFNTGLQTLPHMSDFFLLPFPFFFSLFFDLGAQAWPNSYLILRVPGDFLGHLKTKFGSVNQIERNTFWRILASPIIFFFHLFCIVLLTHVSITCATSIWLIDD